MLPDSFFTDEYGERRSFQRQREELLDREYARSKYGLPATYDPTNLLMDQVYGINTGAPVWQDEWTERGVVPYLMPTKLDQSYFESRQDFSVTLYEDLYRTRVGQEAPEAVKRMDRQLSDPGLGERFNRLLGGEYYYQGEGVVGSAVRGIGKLIDRTVLGYEDYERRVRRGEGNYEGSFKKFTRGEAEIGPGPIESALTMTYGMAEATAVSVAFYAGVSLPMQYVIASSLEELVSDSLDPDIFKLYAGDNTKDTFRGKTKPLAASLLHSLTRVGFVGKHNADVVRAGVRGSGVTSTQLSVEHSAGFITRMINMGRRGAAAAFGSLMTPFLKSIVHFDLSTEAGRTESFEYEQLLEEFREKVGRPITVIEDIPQGKAARLALTEFGYAERVEEIAKMMDKVASYVPVNPLHWIPSVREAMGSPALDRQQAVMVSDLVSFERMSIGAKNFIRSFGTGDMRAMRLGDAPIKFKTMWELLGKLRDSAKLTTSLEKELNQVMTDAEQAGVSLLQKVQALSPGQILQHGKTTLVGGNVAEQMRAYHIGVMDKINEYTRTGAVYKEYSEHQKAINDTMSKLDPKWRAVIGVFQASRPYGNDAKASRVLGYRRAMTTVGAVLLLNRFVDMYGLAYRGISQGAQTAGVVAASQQGDQPFDVFYSSTPERSVSIAASLGVGFYAGVVFPEMSSDVSRFRAIADQHWTYQSAGNAAAKMYADFVNLHDGVDSTNVGTKAATVARTVGNRVKNLLRNAVKGKFGVGAAIVAALATGTLIDMAFGVRAMLLNRNAQQNLALGANNAVVMARMQRLAAETLRTPGLTRGEYVDAAMAMYASTDLAKARPSMGETVNMATQLTTPLFQLALASRSELRPGQGAMGTYDQFASRFSVGVQLMPTTGLGLNVNLPFSFRMGSDYSTFYFRNQQTGDPFMRGLLNVKLFADNILRIPGASNPKDDYISSRHDRYKNSPLYGGGMSPLLVYEPNNTAEAAFITAGALGLARYGGQFIDRKLRNSTSWLGREYNTLAPALSWLSKTIQVGESLTAQLAALPLRGLRAAGSGLGSMIFEHYDLETGKLKQWPIARLAALAKGKGRFGIFALTYMLSSAILDPSSAVLRSENRADSRFMDPGQQLGSLGLTAMGITLLQASGATRSSQYIAAAYYKRTGGDLSKLYESTITRRGLKMTYEEFKLKVAPYFEGAIASHGSAYAVTPRANLQGAVEDDLLDALDFQEQRSIQKRGAKPGEFTDTTLRIKPSGKGLASRMKMFATLMGATALSMSLLAETLPAEVLHGIHRLPFIGSAVEFITRVKPKLPGTEDFYRTGFKGSRYQKGLGGVWETFWNAITFGKFRNADSAYVDTPDPFISFFGGKYGYSLKESGANTFLQNAGVVTDFSASYLQGSLIQGAGQPYRDIKSIYEALYNPVGRARAARIKGRVTDSEADALGSSLGLQMAMSLRQERLTQLSYQYPDETARSVAMDMVLTARPESFSNRGANVGNALRGFNIFKEGMWSPYQAITNNAMATIAGQEGSLSYVLGGMSLSSNNTVSEPDNAWFFPVPAHRLPILPFGVTFGLALPLGLALGVAASVNSLNRAYGRDIYTRLQEVSPIMKRQFLPDDSDHWRQGYGQVETQVIDHTVHGPAGRFDLGGKEMAEYRKEYIGLVNDIIDTSFQRDRVKDPTNATKTQRSLADLMAYYGLDPTVTEAEITRASTQLKKDLTAKLKDAMFSTTGATNSPFEVFHAGADAPMDKMAEQIENSVNAAVDKYVEVMKNPAEGIRFPPTTDAERMVWGTIAWSHTEEANTLRQTMSSSQQLPTQVGADARPMTGRETFAYYDRAIDEVSATEGVIKGAMRGLIPATRFGMNYLAYGRDILQMGEAFFALGGGKHMQAASRTIASPGLAIGMTELTQQLYRRLMPGANTTIGSLVLMGTLIGTGMGLDAYQRSKHGRWLQKANKAAVDITSRGIYNTAKLARRNSFTMAATIGAVTGVAYAAGADPRKGAILAAAAGLGTALTLDGRIYNAYEKHIGRPLFDWSWKQKNSSSPAASTLANFFLPSGLLQSLYENADAPSEFSPFVSALYFEASRKDYAKQRMMRSIQGLSIDDEWIHAELQGRPSTYIQQLRWRSLTAGGDRIMDGANPYRNYLSPSLRLALRQAQSQINSRAYGRMMQVTPPQQNMFNHHLGAVGMVLATSVVLPSANQLTASGEMLARLSRQQNLYQTLAYQSGAASYSKEDFRNRYREYSTLHAGGRLGSALSILLPRPIANLAGVFFTQKLSEAGVFDKEAEQVWKDTQEGTGYLPMFSNANAVHQLRVTTPLDWGGATKRLGKTVFAALKAITQPLTQGRFYHRAVTSAFDTIFNFLNDPNPGNLIAKGYQHVEKQQWAQSVGTWTFNKALATRKWGAKVGKDIAESWFGRGAAWVGSGIANFFTSRYGAATIAGVGLLALGAGVANDKERAGIVSSLGSAAALVGTYALHRQALSKIQRWKNFYQGTSKISSAVRWGIRAGFLAYGLSTVVPMSFSSDPKSGLRPFFSDTRVLFPMTAAVLGFSVVTPVALNLIIEGANYANQQWYDYMTNKAPGATAQTMSVWQKRARLLAPARFKSGANAIGGWFEKNWTNKVKKEVMFIRGTRVNPGDAFPKGTLPLPGRNKLADKARRALGRVLPAMDLAANVGKGLKGLAGSAFDYMGRNVFTTIAYGISAFEYTSSVFRLGGGKNFYGTRNFNNELQARLQEAQLRRQFVGTVLGEHLLGGLGRLAFDPLLHGTVDAEYERRVLEQDIQLNVSTSAVRARTLDRARQEVTAGVAIGATAGKYVQQKVINKYIVNPIGRSLAPAAQAIGRTATWLTRKAIHLVLPKAAGYAADRAFMKAAEAVSKKGGQLAVKAAPAAGKFLGRVLPFADAVIGGGIAAYGVFNVLTAKTNEERARGYRRIAGGMGQAVGSLAGMAMMAGGIVLAKGSTFGVVFTGGASLTGLSPALAMMAASAGSSIAGEAAANRMVDPFIERHLGVKSRYAPRTPKQNTPVDQNKVKRNEEQLRRRQKQDARQQANRDRYDQSTNPTAGRKTHRITKFTVDDGDTIKLDKKLPGARSAEIRFTPVDAPETVDKITNAAQANQNKHGQRAKAQIERLTKGQELIFTDFGVDKHGRSVGTLRTNSGLDLNLELLKEGNALVYSRYLSQVPADQQSLYLEAEAKARRDKVGIWGDPDFIDPETYRHNLRKDDEKNKEPNPVSKFFGGIWKGITSFVGGLFGASANAASSGLQTLHSMYIPFTYSEGPTREKSTRGRISDTLDSHPAAKYLSLSVFPLKGAQVAFDSVYDRINAEKDVAVIAKEEIAKRGLNTKISAWIEAPFFANARSHFVARKPDSVIQRTEVKPGVERVYLDPLDSHVQQRLIDFVISMRKRDDIGAIEIDDYFSIKKEIGHKVMKKHGFTSKRQLSEGLTKIMRRVRRAAGNKPIVFSYNGSIEHHAMYDHQDVKQWVREGLIDEIGAQLYRNDVGIFKKDFERELKVAKSLGIKKFNILLSPTYKGEQIPEEVLNQQREYVALRASQEEDIAISSAIFNPNIDPEVKAQREAKEAKENAPPGLWGRLTQWLGSTAKSVLGFVFGTPANAATPPSSYSKTVTDTMAAQERKDKIYGTTGRKDNWIQSILRPVGNFINRMRRAGQDAINKAKSLAESLAGMREENAQGVSVDTLVQQQLAQSMGITSGFTGGSSRVQAVARAAAKLGVSTEDFATLIAVESSFNPKLSGGSGGVHYGLIQWNPDARAKELPGMMRQLGIDPKTDIRNVPFEQQTELAVLWVQKRWSERDGRRGKKIESIHDVYRMINPGAYSSRGDSWGTKGSEALKKGGYKNKEALQWLKAQGAQQTQPGQQIKPPSVDQLIGIVNMASRSASTTSVGDTTDLGRRLATVAERTAKSMGGYTSRGQCYIGVADAIEEVVTGRKYSGYLEGIPAWTAADQLARKKEFTEVKGLKPDQLKNLPPGAVIVWLPRTKVNEPGWAPGRSNSHPEYGHIAISLGDGREASDHLASMTNGTGGYRVFLPQGNQIGTKDQGTKQTPVTTLARGQYFDAARRRYLEDQAYAAGGEMGREAVRKQIEVYNNGLPENIRLAGLEADRRGVSNFIKPQGSVRVVPSSELSGASTPQVESNPGTIVSPIRGTSVSQLVSYRPSAAQGFDGLRDGGARLHRKIDFDARVGAGQGGVVQAIQGGTATYRAWTDNSGVVIVNTFDAKGRSVTYEYGHLALAEIKKLFNGKQTIQVASGQRLSTVTMDRLSSGPHLDLGIKVDNKYVHPQQFLRDPSKFISVPRATDAERVVPSSPSNIPRANKPDVGTLSRPQPKGVILGLGHTTPRGGGADGELAMLRRTRTELQTIARGLGIANLEFFADNQGGSGNDQQQFINHLNRLRKRADQADYLGIELHYDSAKVGKSGVIPPRNIDPLTKALSDEYGSFGVSHRDGLAAPNRGIPILELAPMDKANPQRDAYRLMRTILQRQPGVLKDAKGNPITIQQLENLYRRNPVQKTSQRTKEGTETMLAYQESRRGAIGLGGQATARTQVLADSFEKREQQASKEQVQPTRRAITPATQVGQDNLASNPREVFNPQESVPSADLMASVGSDAGIPSGVKPKKDKDKPKTRWLDFTGIGADRQRVNYAPLPTGRGRQNVRDQYRIAIITDETPLKQIERGTSFSRAMYNEVYYVRSAEDIEKALQTARKNSPNGRDTLISMHFHGTGDSFALKTNKYTEFDGAFIDNAMQKAGFNRENVTLMLEVCNGTQSYFNSNSESKDARLKPFSTKDAYGRTRNVYVDYGAYFLSSPLPPSNQTSNRRYPSPFGLGGETYVLETNDGKAQASGAPGVRRRYTLGSSDALSYYGSVLGYMYQGVLKEEAVRKSNPRVASNIATFAPGQKPTSDVKEMEEHAGIGYTLKLFDLHQPNGKVAQEMLVNNPFGLGEDLYRYIVKRQSAWTEFDVLRNKAEKEKNMKKAAEYGLKGMQEKTKLYAQTADYIDKLLEIYVGLSQGGVRAAKALEKLERLRKEEKNKVIKPTNIKLPSVKDLRSPLTSSTFNVVPATNTRDALNAAVVAGEFQLATIVAAGATKAQIEYYQTPSNPVFKQAVSPELPPANEPGVAQTPAKVAVLPTGGLSLNTGDAPPNEPGMSDFNEMSYMAA